MEKQTMTLPEFLDSLEGVVLGLLQNIRAAKEGARLQSESILKLEARAKELEAKMPSEPKAP